MPCPLRWPHSPSFSCGTRRQFPSEPWMKSLAGFRDHSCTKKKKNHTNQLEPYQGVHKQDVHTMRHVEGKFTSSVPCSLGGHTHTPEFFMEIASFFSLWAGRAECKSCRCLWCGLDTGKSTVLSVVIRLKLGNAFLLRVSQGSGPGGRRPSPGPRPRSRQAQLSPALQAPTWGTLPNTGFENWSKDWVIFLQFFCKSVVSTLLPSTNVKKGQMDASADKSVKILFDDRLSPDFCPLLSSIKNWVTLSGYSFHCQLCTYVNKVSLHLYKIRRESMTKLVASWQ